MCAPALGVGAIIGAGIFVLSGLGAHYAGPGLMLSFVISGLGCAFAGLCYAEFAAMIPIALKATQSTTLPATRAYMQWRGVSAALYDKLSRAILELLDQRELTAAAIKRALKAKADVSAILWVMCDEGLLIRGRPAGGWRDSTHGYARLGDYFPDVDLDALSERTAIKRLVQAYLAAFGPASETDVAWWTGLTKAKVRAALQDLSGEVASVSVSGLTGTFLLLKRDLADLREVESPGEPSVNLLPTLDPYLMGYRERQRYLDDEFRPFLFDRGGNATSTILVNGRAEGVWDFTDEPEPTVKLFLFRKASPRLRDEIEKHADRAGKFIADEPVRVRTCRAIVPLPAVSCRLSAAADIGNVDESLFCVTLNKVPVERRRGVLDGGSLFLPALFP